MNAINPIKQLRDAGLTHKAIGEAVGATAQTVWRWEHRKRTPRKRHLKALQEKFGITPAAVLGLDCQCECEAAQ